MPVRKAPEMIFLTVEEVSNPRHQIVQVFRNFWWPTTAEGKVAIYVRSGRYESPQANMKREIAEQVRSHPLLTGPAVQIPLAFIRWEND